jgi:hypothetical protein
MGARLSAQSRATPSRQTRIADQVWAVVALLHREHPDRADFAIDEIMTRARRETISRPLRPSFRVHLTQHCVANRPPNPGRWRILMESAPGRRRLFRPGDSFDPAREGARTIPEPGDLPPEYGPLLTWYRQEYERLSRRSQEPDTLLGLRGTGRALWSDEPADTYIKRLREGWE